MSSITNSLIKKEILYPSVIGDWTTYKAPKTEESISISKSLSNSHKTISEEKYNELLFQHQELFEEFFERAQIQLNTNIDIESISIQLISQEIFMQSITSDIYQSKLNIPKLSQVDIVLDQTTARFIAHRLCGGQSAPTATTPLTTIELTIISSINSLLTHVLSTHWTMLFSEQNCDPKTNFGAYIKNPQQSDSESLIEITAHFKMLKQTNLSIKLLYSLPAIETLFNQSDKLSKKINETISFSKQTLANTMISTIATIGSTQLSLNEIQSLERGDVVLLEEKEIASSIELTIDNKLKFNGLPIATEKNLGVQILELPTYDKLLNKLNQPESGPSEFFKNEKKAANTTDQNSSNTTESLPQSNEEPVNNNTEPPLDNSDEGASNESLNDSLDDDIDQPEAEPNPTDDTPPAPTDDTPPLADDAPPPPTNDAPLPSENDDEDDDFSWDDLDE